MMKGPVPMDKDKKPPHIFLILTALLLLTFVPAISMAFL